MCSDLLNLIRDTENDDLTSVLQRFVTEYSDDIAPLAIEITTHLVCLVLESAQLVLLMSFCYF